MMAETLTLSPPTASTMSPYTLVDVTTAMRPFPPASAVFAAGAPHPVRRRPMPATAAVRKVRALLGTENTSVLDRLGWVAGRSNLQLSVSLNRNDSYLGATRRRVIQASGFPWPGLHP